MSIIVRTIPGMPTHRVEYRPGETRGARASAEVYGLAEALAVAKHYREQGGMPYCANDDGSKIRILATSAGSASGPEIIASWVWSAGWVQVNGQQIPGIADDSPRAPALRRRRPSRAKKSNAIK